MSHVCAHVRRGADQTCDLTGLRSGCNISLIHNACLLITGLSTIPRCIISSSCCCNKIPVKSNFRKEGFVLRSPFESTVLIMVERTCQWTHEVSAHTPHLRWEAGTDEPWCPACFPIIFSLAPSPWNGTTHIQDWFSFLDSSIWNPTHKCAYRLISWRFQMLSS